MKLKPVSNPTDASKAEASCLFFSGPFWLYASFFNILSSLGLDSDQVK